MKVLAHKGLTFRRVIGQTEKVCQNGRLCKRVQRCFRFSVKKFLIDLYNIFIYLYKMLGQRRMGHIFLYS